MPFINLENGLATHYLTFPAKNRDLAQKSITGPNNQNSPAILLHGLGAHAHSWLLQFPVLLREGIPSYAPDFRGYGATSFPQPEVSIDILAEDLEYFMTALDLQRASLIGVSLGGMVALNTAIRRPELVDRLILISTAAAVRPANLSQVRYYLKRLAYGLLRGREAQARVVAKTLFPEETDEFFRASLRDQILASDRLAYRKTLLSLARFDLRDQLGRVNAPALIISGSLDTTIHPSQQAALARGIQGSSFVEISDAGHALPVEAQETLNHLIIEFLRPQVD